MRYVTCLLALILCMAGPLRAELKLFVFDCGTLTLDDIAQFGLSSDATPVREMFIPCYLVEHPKGRLLFDAGLPMALAGRGEVRPEAGFSMRYEVALVDQLQAMSLEPDSIDFVAFSHLHFDHVGSANLFTNSTLLLQRAEYQAGFVERNATIFQLDLFDALADAPRQLLDGDHDVFGDGLVRLISAPGHTPGHQMLLIRLAETGPILLSGDLYHFRRSRDLRSVPVFNTDRDQTLASMERIERLLADEGATLWIEHDMALADTLRKAPAFYR